MTDATSNPSAASPSSAASSEPTSSAGAEPSAPSGMSYAHTAQFETTPTMETASAEVNHQFQESAHEVAEQPQEETIESLRLKLAQLENQQPRLEKGLPYTIGGPGEQSVHQSIFEDNAAAWKATAKRLADLEKAERRKSFMACAAQRKNLEEEEGPGPEES